MIKMKSCPEGKELNPITKRCIKKCKEFEIRYSKTGHCKTSGKCPEDKELNPITKRCIKKCKDGEIRNVKTRICEKIKQPKPPRTPSPPKDLPLPPRTPSPPKDLPLPPRNPQTALSIIFKERIRYMPNNLDDKEILEYAKIINNIIELENDLKKIGKEKTNKQTAFSFVFKERIKNMPDDIDDKEILVYAKNIIKLVRDINKIGKGKKNPKK